MKKVIPVMALVFATTAVVSAAIIKATGEPKRFKIGLAQKDSSHPFFGKGYKVGFTLDGEQGKPIVLTRGVTYKFDVDTNVKHDFYFSTVKAGWGAGTVTDGVKGQFTYRGTVSITPGDTMPDVIYYACRNHKYMGGEVHIANQGDEVEVVKEVAQVASGEGQVSEREVKNKLMYVGMILKVSKMDPMVIDQAKVLIDEAHIALDAGKNNEAMAAATVAVALLKGNRAPRKVNKDALRGQYITARESLKNTEASFAKRSKAFKSDGGLDEKKYEALKKEAENLAEKQEYKKANHKIEEAQGLLSMAFSEIMKGNEIVDERDLSDPKVKFKYELDRYKGYEELIPVGLEMKKPSAMMKKMMMDQVDRSKKTVEEAQRRADNGNYNDANILINRAIGEVRRALRLIGVR